MTDRRSAYRSCINSVYQFTNTHLKFTLKFEHNESQHRMRYQASDFKNLSTSVCHIYVVDTCCQNNFAATLLRNWLLNTYLVRKAGKN